MDDRKIRTHDGVGLHVGVHGSGPDVVMLSGGPGNVHYLERDHLAPMGTRSWFPEPRGVGRSGGGPHSMARAVDDLEEIRQAVGVDRWIVVGHSWGSDLAVRYALDCPTSVVAVVGIAGHGLHRDRTWSQAYELGKLTEPGIDVPSDRQVWQTLSDSFTEWVHEPGLLRALADTLVSMTFIGAGDDIRPAWPLRQLANLVPAGSFQVVPDVPHDFWSTHPETWRAVLTQACRATADTPR